jgi:hypothetical protein
MDPDPVFKKVLDPDPAPKAQNTALYKGVKRYCILTTIFLFHFLKPEVLQTSFLDP